MATIDLNCDLGEGFGAWEMGNDAAMIELATSVNVACGFHAGDPLTMAESVGRAARHGVVLGAHPGYRDLVGFGRRALDTSPAELAAELAALPTRGIGMTKRLFDAAPTSSLEDQLEREAQLQSAAVQTEDFREGVAAFLEKRQPRFVGR